MNRRMYLANCHCNSMKKQMIRMAVILLVCLVCLAGVAGSAKAEPNGTSIKPGDSTGKDTGGNVAVGNGTGAGKAGKSETDAGLANPSPAQIIQKVQALLNQSCPDCQELAADVEAALKAYRKIVSKVESRFGSVEKFNEEYKRISAKWYSVNPDLTKDMDVFAPEEKGIAEEVLSLEVTIRETPRILNIYKESITEQEKKFSEYRKNGVTPDKFGLELYNSEKKDLNSLEKELRDAKAKLKEKKKELEKIKRNRDAMSLEELSALKKKEMELSKIWGSLFNKFIGLTMRLPLLSGCIEDYCPKKEEPGKGVIPGGEVVVGGGTGSEAVGTGKEHPFANSIQDQYDRLSPWYRKVDNALKDCRNIKVRAYLNELRKAARKYTKSIQSIKNQFGSLGAFFQNSDSKEFNMGLRVADAENALEALLGQADGMKKLCAAHKGSGTVAVGNGTGTGPAESQKGDGSVKTNKFGGYPDSSTKSGSGYDGYDTEESSGTTGSGEVVVGGEPSDIPPELGGGKRPPSKDEEIVNDLAKLNKEMAGVAETTGEDTGGNMAVGNGTGKEHPLKKPYPWKNSIQDQYDRLSPWYRKVDNALKDCRNIKVRAYLNELRKAARKYTKSIQSIKNQFGSLGAFFQNSDSKEFNMGLRVADAENALEALLGQADGMKKLCAAHKGSGTVAVGNGTGTGPAESQKGDGSVKTNKFGGYPDSSTESGSGYGGYDTEESGGVALPGGVTSDQGAEIPSPPPLPPLPKLPDSVIGEVAGCPECDSLKNILVKMAYDLGKLRQENISQGAWLKISSLQGEIAKLREVELPARKEKRYKELIDDAKQSKQKSLKEGDEYRIERDQRDIEAWQKQLADLKRNHKKYQKRFDLAQKKAKLLNKQSDTLMAQLQLESDLRDELERGIAMYNNCIADCQKRKKTSTLSDGDDLDCPDCGVELVQVIHHSGNNPLDTTDPVAGGSTIDDTTVTPPPVVTPPTVDTTPPVVTAPASIFVAATNTIGVPKTNGTIATFLNGATATDNVGVVGPITNNAPATFPTTPQVFIKSSFPFGTSTAVTFSASDAAGNTGTATANVEVFDFTGPAFTTGACALPIVHTALGGSVLISDPTIQAFITCVKGAFTDNIDGVIPASGVTVFNDPTPSPLPLLDNPPVTLPPAPESFPAPTTIPSGSINAVRMTPINFKAADNAKNLGWFFTVVTVISP